jgi:predicted ribosome quality control (RQC) complex YloA/Tae2 family protein
MQIPNLTLSYQILSLKESLEGAIVKKVQELPNNWLKVRLHTRAGSKDLIIAKSILFLSSYKLPAKQLTSGYGAFLRKQLQNKKILAIEQHEFDRIVLLEFEKFFLVLELFAKGNILLLDKNYKIISAYRKERWKDRQLRKGFSYKFPSSKGLNPLKVSAKKLQEIFKESKIDAVRTLINSINLAPVIAEEILSRAAVEKQAKPDSITKKQLQNIQSLLKDFFTVSEKKLKPVVVEKGEKILLSFPFKSIEPLHSFNSLNEAIDENLSKEALEKESMAETVAVDNKTARLQQNLKEQLLAKERFEKAIEENKRKAELLYLNYQAVNEILEAARKSKSEEEVMYKTKSFSSLIKKFDPKNKKVFIELNEKNN